MKIWLFSGWLEASFQDELDPGNAQHEEHARNLVVTLVQQLEAKALESGDFLTKNKLEEIIASIKVRLKLFKLSCVVSSYRSVNLKSSFSWNSIAQKMNEIFDKILL